MVWNFPSPGFGPKFSSWFEQRSHWLPFVLLYFACQPKNLISMPYLIQSRTAMWNQQWMYHYGFYILCCLCYKRCSAKLVSFTRPLSYCVWLVHGTAKVRMSIITARITCSTDCTKLTCRISRTGECNWRVINNYLGRPKRKCFLSSGWGGGSSREGGRVLCFSVFI